MNNIHFIVYYTSSLFFNRRIVYSRAQISLANLKARENSIQEGMKGRNAVHKCNASSTNSASLHKLDVDGSNGSCFVTVQYIIIIAL